MSQVIEWVMGLSLVRSVYIQLLSGFYQITWNQTGGGLPAQIFMHAPPRLSDLEIVRPDVSVCYNCKFQGTSLSLNSSILYYGIIIVSAGGAPQSAQEGEKDQRKIPGKNLEGSVSQVLTAEGTVLAVRTEYVKTVKHERTGHSQKCKE